MSSTTRTLITGLLVLVAAFLVWLVIPAGTSFPGNAEAPSSSPALVERGAYLATAANCGTCHTAPGGEAMAGGLAFNTPFGTIYSTNITPDADTGIGDWSFADFANSMRHGVRPDGTHLYPVFPYTSFTKIGDDDLAALFTYLNSVPAVRQSAPANELSFPFNLRILMKAWKALFFDNGEFVADESQPGDWNRGAYLVEAFAHCGECHSPRNAFGAAKNGLAMSGGEYLDKVAGGKYKPWFAPDLTSSEAGLGLWAHEDLADYLHTGRNAFLDSIGPMNEVIMHSTRHLDRADVEAMATYLKSLPAASPVAREPVSERIMGRGRTIYNLHCGTCHLPTGLGDPEMGPKLNQGSLVVQAPNPASMINVILYAPDVADLPPRWRMPMDEFQYILDDEEVAAVASYIRNSWDNRAGLVTPDQVARQR